MGDFSVATGRWAERVEIKSVIIWDRRMAAAWRKKMARESCRLERRRVEGRARDVVVPTLWGRADVWRGRAAE